MVAIGVFLIVLMSATVALIVADASRAYGHAGWDAVAECESNGRWGYDGYHKGGLQFLQGTWDYAAERYAGRPDLVGVNPASVSRETQIEVAEALRQAEGLGHWPVCGRRWFPDSTPQQVLAEKVRRYEAAQAHLAALPVGSVDAYLQAVYADRLAIDLYLYTLWIQ